MKRFWKMAVAAGSAVSVVGGVLLAATSAGAATTPTPGYYPGYGFDETPHIIVGGGSDTTYRAQLGLTDLYDQSGLAGCEHNTTIGPPLGQCNVKQIDANNRVNWDGDTVGQANPYGSGTGIGSLNGFPTAGQTDVSYPGTVNPAPSYLACGAACPGTEVDFARSSRAAKASGGQASGGNELTYDTTWGFAEDGIQAIDFNGRGADVTTALNLAGNTTLTPNELFHVYNCDYHKWSDIPSLHITSGAANDGPIVPIGVNASSGTFGSFQFDLVTYGGAPGGFNPNSQTCVRKLADGTFPLENDEKLYIGDIANNASTVQEWNGSGYTATSEPAGLTTVAGGGTASFAAGSYNNPANFLTWGSAGVMGAFPYLNDYTVNGTRVIANPMPINDILPSGSNILSGAYLFDRTVYHFTHKQDADCPKVSGTCDFTAAAGKTGTLTGEAFAASDTVAAGSNGVHTNTYKAGSGTLNVASTAGFPSSGKVFVTHSGTVDALTYTGTTGTTFTGVSLAGGFTDVTLATGDSVLGGAQTSSYALTGGVAPTAGDFFQIGGAGANVEVLSVTGSGPYTITWDSTTVLANGAAVQKSGPTISGATTDFNVVGPSSGIGGAVREYTRFLCRGSQAQEGIDPFTGKNFSLEITGAVNASGFTTVPTALQSTGSRCQVIT